MTTVFMVERERGASFVKAAWSPFARVFPKAKLGGSNCAGFHLRVGAWRIPFRVSFHDGGAQLEMADRSVWLPEGA